jgi:hypothetical protein
MFKIHMAFKNMLLITIIKHKVKKIWFPRVIKQEVLRRTHCPLSRDL